MLSSADPEARTLLDQQTPLHYAAKNDAVGSIRLLLQAGASISCTDYKHRTPLHLAANHGTTDNTTNIITYITADITSDTTTDIITYIITDITSDTTTDITTTDHCWVITEITDTNLTHFWLTTPTTDTNDKSLTQ